MSILFETADANKSWTWWILFLQTIIVTMSRLSVGEPVSTMAITWINLTVEIAWHYMRMAHVSSLTIEHYFTEIVNMAIFILGAAVFIIIITAENLVLVNASFSDCWVLMGRISRRFIFLWKDKRHSVFFSMGLKRPWLSFYSLLKNIAQLFNCLVIISHPWDFITGMVQPVFNELCRWSLLWAIHLRWEGM